MAGWLKALYVDDEADLLELVKIFLERSGKICVSTTESPKRALEILKKEKFDVIISDYQMPDCTGLDLLEDIRQYYPYLPFILFTSIPEDELFIPMCGSGLNFYLQKDASTCNPCSELECKIHDCCSVAQVNGCSEGIHQSDPVI